jgi:ABC-type multidrug transport system ATPase subunit|tara:strand:- start:1756 stop:2361 length:606 start_codon:yes stop_codon:yes gene_type:complete
MICIKNVSYNINDKKIIKNVSLNIDSMGTTTFMGANGAGKTTLLKLIANIIKPTSGHITFLNKKNRYKIGFLFQNHIFLNRSVQDNLLHCISGNNTYAVNIKIIKNILDKFNLSEYLSININELSLGEKQCISLIRSLINDPEILFLDEPFNNLDEYYKKYSKDLLKNYSENKKIILITHSNEDALFFSNDIVFISDGKIL